MGICCIWGKWLALRCIGANQTKRNQTIVFARCPSVAACVATRPYTQGCPSCQPWNTRSPRSNPSRLKNRHGWWLSVRNRNVCRSWRKKGGWVVRATVTKWGGKIMNQTPHAGSDKLNVVFQSHPIFNIMGADDLVTYGVGALADICMEYFVAHWGSYHTVDELEYWICCMCHVTMLVQCQKLGKIFTGPTYKLILSFTVISDVYCSFMPNKTKFTKYCLTQWISDLPGRELWNPLSNAVLGKFHGSQLFIKLSQFSQVSGMAIVLIFNTAGDEYFHHKWVYQVSGQNLCILNQCIFRPVSSAPTPYQRMRPTCLPSVQSRPLAYSPSTWRGTAAELPRPRNGVRGYEPYELNRWLGSKTSAATMLS